MIQREIIYGINEKASKSYERELKNLIYYRKNISEFIVITKETLDGIGVKLVAEALRTVDKMYKKADQENITG